MPSNSLRNPVRPRLASGFRSPVDATGVPANMAGMPGETGIPTPDPSAAKGNPPSVMPSRHPEARCLARRIGSHPPPLERSHVCPFRHQSQILPLLLANRGYAELEILPTPCKQRATLLSNRGKTRVVEPPRRPSRTTHPSSLPFSDHYAGRPIPPDSQGKVGIETHRTGSPASNFLPPTSFLIATRTYSPKELTRRKHKMIRFSNRNKIHFMFLPHPGADRAGRSTAFYRNYEANRCRH